MKMDCEVIRPTIPGLASSPPESEPVLVPQRTRSLRSEFMVTMPTNQAPRVHRNVTEDVFEPGFEMNEFKCLKQKPQQIALSEGAQRILETPNAGGNSVWSEVLSFELFKTIYRMQLLRTEMEIDYFFQNYNITDYCGLVGSTRVGVSVTRAMKYKGIFTEDDARILLKKKLNGVIESTKNVAERDAWQKQILHVWAQEQYIADIFKSVYDGLVDSLKANTMVVVTVVQNADWIFK